MIQIAFLGDIYIDIYLNICIVIVICRSTDTLQQKMTKNISLLHIAPDAVENAVGKLVSMQINFNIEIQRYCKKIVWVFFFQKYCKI